MRLQSSSNDFHATFAQNKGQVVWTEVRADTQTPVSTFLRVAQNPDSGEIEPYSFLFESVEGGRLWGRHSLIALSPDLRWSTNTHNQVELSRWRPDKTQEKATSENGSWGKSTCDDQPLASLQSLIDACQIPDLPPEIPPMVAGLFGFMGYDMVRQMERLPDTCSALIDVPQSLFVRPQIVLVFDRLKETLLIATPCYPDQYLHYDNAAACLDSAAARISQTLAKLETGQPLAPTKASNQQDLSNLQSNMSPEDFKSMVVRAKDYIAAGDIFQVVLSQRFSSPFELDSFDFYRELRLLNPSPYLFYLNFDGFALAGSSPEVLIRLKDQEVTIRPIAGTRKRGTTESEDQALAVDLLADEKELAEHLMLLDLGRNDVGRVAQIGTVTVTEEFKIELYSHVMHIVSNVTGQLRPELTALDALKAGFPAGTVSGAPKIRAMEIIDELEGHKRATYAGAVGYFDCRGNMDTCIALRTALLKDKQIHIQAGAGVVADSNPQSEHEECENKARALVRAAEQALARVNARLN